MRLSALVPLALGLALFAGLLAAFDLRSVLPAVGALGWGLAAVAAFHVVPLYADSEAWRRLCAPADAPRLALAMRNRWIGESVNTLLPAAYVGGELVRMRIAALDGMRAALAGATILADLALAAATLVPFALLGLAALVLGGGGQAVGGALIAAIAVLAAAAVCVAALLASAPLGRLARLIERVAGAALAGGAARVDAELTALFRRRRRLAAAALWRLAGWVVGAGEAWLILWLLGVGAGPLEALAFEAIGQALRTAAFAVPAGIGVQEGGYVLIGGALGIGPEAALALSLVKRVRELALGLPGLLAWQLAEGARAWRGRPRP